MAGTEETVEVYLLECHEWSDGDDEHEEDHNDYYDLKYFYVSRRVLRPRSPQRVRRYSYTLGVLIPIWTMDISFG
jgi:hypothetical protein